MSEELVFQANHLLIKPPIDNVVRGKRAGVHGLFVMCEASGECACNADLHEFGWAAVIRFPL
jgi:hypothetical protein